VDLQFEEWARARTPALLRTAYLLTGSQHSAEDLVQAALERVMPAWGRIRENPDAYARVVLHRENAGQWRRRRVREVSSDDAPEPGVADDSARVEIAMVLQAALARLTARQRAVLVLRFYEDRAEAEIADILSCSIGTVKSQTHKALRAMRSTAPELDDLVGRKQVTDV
jgi:RNA polymerase sigma-70 factor (sigma-E family)